MEITPAILAKTESDFREQVDRVRPLKLPLHIDVMDGVFVPQVSWADPSVVEQIADGLDFEAHLMVSSPEHAAIVWLSTSAKRVWIHVESTDREDLIFRSAPDQLKQIGLVINPDTPISSVSRYLDTIPAVLVMGVTPGAQGQLFQEIALEKIAELKRLRPGLWIKVDGGVNPDNIVAIREAGADQVAIGSELTQQPDVREALLRFNRALNPEDYPPEQPSPALYGSQDIEVADRPTLSLEEELARLATDPAETPTADDDPLNDLLDNKPEA